ncbi:MAG: cytochrome c3 family protein [Candidatus Omnitrophica bacterium]|nr:cytochrome c3 family protein [Candidatus Omnitrophota bacterium]
MAQLFPKHFNTLAKASILGGLLFLVLIGTGLYIWSRSVFSTQIGIAKDQPVPFSHKHHVEGLGIDCRYCHTAVEKSSFAGIPPTKTCMNCHSIIWNEAPMLAPVRESWKNKKPLEWNRVHNLADFVQFNHSAHIAKGVACTTCHGQVNEMPLMWKERSLQMQWCLSCHREPEKFIGPKDKVFDPRWKAPDQAKMGHELVSEYNVKKLTNCSVCHR